MSYLYGMSHDLDSNIIIQFICDVTFEIKNQRQSLCNGHKIIQLSGTVRQ